MLLARPTPQQSLSVGLRNDGTTKAYLKMGEVEARIGSIAKYLVDHTVRVRFLGTELLLVMPGIPTGSKAIGFGRTVPVFAITIEGLRVYGCPERRGLGITAS